MIEDKKLRKSVLKLLWNERQAVEADRRHNDTVVIPAWHHYWTNRTAGADRPDHLGYAKSDGFYTGQLTIIYSAIAHLRGKLHMTRCGYPDSSSEVYRFVTAPKNALKIAAGISDDRNIFAWTMELQAELVAPLIERLVEEAQVEMQRAA